MSGKAAFTALERRNGRKHARDSNGMVNAPLPKSGRHKAIGAGYKRLTKQRQPLDLAKLAPALKKIAFDKI